MVNVCSCYSWPLTFSLFFLALLLLYEYDGIIVWWYDDIIVYSKITPPIYHSIKSYNVQWPMSQVATCDRRGVTDTGMLGSILWSSNIWKVVYCDPWQMSWVLSVEKFLAALSTLFTLLYTYLGVLHIDCVGVSEPSRPNQKYWNRPG